MSEERITEVHTPDSDARAHTTVITERPRSGAGTWFLIALLLVVLAAGLWAFTTIGGAEVAKDNAVRDAANSVGSAADQVGAAAQDAADTVAK